MEVTGVVCRQPPYLAAFGGGGGGSRIIETQKIQTLVSSNLSYNASRSSLYGGESQSQSSRFGSMRSRRRVKEWAGGFCGFRDESHLLYYYGGSTPVLRCGGNKQEKEIKMKLKMLKSLSKELSSSSRFGSSTASAAVVDVDVVDDVGGSGPVQTNLISEAAEVLMKQLEQMREEEKAMKRKKKEEKAMMKSDAGAKMKCMKGESESSSSSSESSDSSDSDCGQVIDMKQLRNEAVPVGVQQPLLGEPQQLTQSDTAPVLTVSTLVEESKTKEITGFHDCSVLSTGQETLGQPSTSVSVSTSVLNNNTVVEGKVETRIEVCMGNKCKKMGGVALLEEFEKVMGKDGAVGGCKCMGKCRNGPNVRVLNSIDEGDTSVAAAANPLFIGVGLEDVGSIVANFIGEDVKTLAPPPAVSGAVCC